LFSLFIGYPIEEWKRAFFIVMQWGTKPYCMTIKPRRISRLLNCARTIQNSDEITPRHI